MTDQFKRNIAYKFRIGDLLLGKPIVEGNRFNFLELGDRKIVRVNVVGNIVDKYESEGDKNYIFFTLDDGSGQIKLKSFGDSADKFRNVSQGQTVLIIGVLRYFNNEVYISPEIIKEKDPKYLLVRKMEIEKEKSQNAVPVEREQIIAIKDKILEKIKNAEEEGGIDLDKIIMELRETSPEIINQEIKKLLEEGIIFEPRPGKVRWLG
jgi:RPA family protein